MTPTTLGRYEILGELGKGAMGVVYLARDPLIGRQLALKTFRLGYSAGDQELEQFRARFLREAQSAGILSHPNIVTIHDVVEGPDGGFFIAMEYVKGTDLKQLMQRQEQLAVRFVLDVVAQIAEGLHYAHSKGVVHRDIKPANIILTADKQVKITDFGIARVDASNLTVEGQLLGTPNYMAPEQVQGFEVDHRADLFSLGVLFYEMLTRHKPFQGENLTVVTHRIVNDAFTPPERYVHGLPPQLLTILNRALRKDPEERYRSGQAMASDLRAILAPNQTASKAPQAPPPPVAESFLPEIEPSSPPNVTTLGANVESHKTISQPSPVPPTAKPVSSAPAASVEAARPPAWRRPLLVALLTILLGGAIGAALLFTLPGEDVVDRMSPEDDLRRRTLPYVREGKRLLAEGEPTLALETFQKALDIVPDDQDLRRLRDQANQAVLDYAGLDQEAIYIQDRLKKADEALVNRQYQRAIRLAEEVLEVDPRNTDAERISEEARRVVERKRRIQERFDTSGRTATAETVERSSSSASSTAVQAQTQLNIDFQTEISEGILTVYAGQPSPLFKQNFRFTEKGGLLKRSRKKPGSLQSTHTLPSGEIDFRIYVYNKGLSTLSQQLTVHLPANGISTLLIRLNAKGVLSAELR